MPTRLTLPAIAAILGICATAASAEAVKGFYFRLERGTPRVEGIYSVGGYDPAQLVSMMGRYCEAGKIGQIAHVGKARKRRGQILQKFQTSCPGRMPARFRGKSAGIEIEYITNGEYKGKHLVEITTSDRLGNIVDLLETIRP